MGYLADSLEVDLFHPGVERMGFIIPRGVINKRLENKRLTPFIRLSSQLSDAPSLFQAAHHPLPTYRSSTNKQTAHPPSTSSNHASSSSGAGTRQPASPQRALSFSRQHGRRIQRGDALVNKPANLREGLTALPGPGVRESGISQHDSVSAQGGRP